jgi:hypothetical protein
MLGFYQMSIFLLIIQPLIFVRADESERFRKYTKTKSPTYTSAVGLFVCVGRVEYGGGETTPHSPPSNLRWALEIFSRES